MFDLYILSLGYARVHTPCAPLFLSNALVARAVLSRFVYSPVSVSWLVPSAGSSEVVPSLGFALGLSVCCSFLISAISSLSLSCSSFVQRSLTSFCSSANLVFSQGRNLRSRLALKDPGNGFPFRVSSE